MSEEWRKLPEFPNYEITSDGDVRNRWTKKKLKELQNKNTGAWAYSLRYPDGTTTQRNFWGLIYSAWPVDEFPDYTINKKGQVRNRTRNLVTIRTDKQDGTEYVLFRVQQYDGKRISHRRTINWLMSKAFPELQEAA